MSPCMLGRSLVRSCGAGSAMVDVVVLTVKGPRMKVESLELNSDDFVGGGILVTEVRFMIQDSLVRVACCFIKT